MRAGWHLFFAFSGYVTTESAFSPVWNKKPLSLKLHDRSSEQRLVLELNLCPNPIDLKSEEAQRELTSLDKWKFSESMRLYLVKKGRALSKLLASRFDVYVSVYVYTLGVYCFRSREFDSNWNRKWCERPNSGVTVIYLSTGTHAAHAGGASITRTHLKKRKNEKKALAYIIHARALSGHVIYRLVSLGNAMCLLPLGPAWFIDTTD